MKRTSLLILLSSVLVLSSSCGDNISNDSLFDKITHTKWSKDPYEGPGGFYCDILIPPGVDYLDYYAFNRDSTVDNWSIDQAKTGLFFINGSLVTCLFREDLVKSESSPKNNGDYYHKIILKYEDGKLYLHDNLYRDTAGNWVSYFDIEYRTLFYDNAGSYESDRDLGYYPFHAGDSTDDGWTVFDRYLCRCETYFKHGKRNGPYHKITNGKLTIFGAYTDGIPTGNWYFYGVDGHLDYEVSNIRVSSANKFGKKYEADAISHLWKNDRTCRVYFSDDDFSLQPNFRSYKLTEDREGWTR